MANRTGQRNSIDKLGYAELIRLSVEYLTKRMQHGQVKDTEKTHIALEMSKKGMPQTFDLGDKTIKTMADFVAIYDRIQNNN